MLCGRDAQADGDHRAQSHSLLFGHEPNQGSSVHQLHDPHVGQGTQTPVQQEKSAEIPKLHADVQIPAPLLLLADPLSRWN